MPRGSNAHLPETAIYCGWGPIAESRNQGDALCYTAAAQLLQSWGFSGLRDIRQTSDPVTQPWKGDLIVGGGTVLPSVFTEDRAPGLRSASRIFIFGSGCLSLEEVKAKGIIFDPEPFVRAEVVGVRGPLSAEHYREFFGKSVPYIGDLAFALTPDEPLEPRAGAEHQKLSFFITESGRPQARVDASLSEVVSLYSEFAKGFIDGTKTFVTTQSERAPYEESGLGRHFNEYTRVETATELIGSVVSSDFVITERLHPAIIAATHGIPFIYLQTTSKSRDLQRLLAAHAPRSGIDECFVDMSRPVSPLSLTYNRVSRMSELPDALHEASQAIQKGLLAASGQLVQRLCQLPEANGTANGRHLASS